MSRIRNKELRRQRQRRAKLHQLKARYAASKDAKERERILEKIRRISVYLPNDLKDLEK